jgi:hypothetical protein
MDCFWVLIVRESPLPGMPTIYAQSARLKLRGARHFPHPEGSRPKGIVSP